MLLMETKLKKLKKRKTNQYSRPSYNQKPPHSYALPKTQLINTKPRFQWSHEQIFHPMTSSYYKLRWLIRTNQDKTEEQSN
jgi:hypothetical protein